MQEWSCVRALGSLLGLLHLKAGRASWCSVKMRGTFQACSGPQPPPPLLRQPLSSTQQQAPPAQPPPNHTCTTKQARQAATGRKHRPRTFHKVKDAKLALNKRVATGQLRRGGARLLLRGRHLQEVRQGHMCWWMMMDEGMDEWAAASWGRPGAAARPASARGEAGAHAAMAGGSMG